MITEYNGSLNDFLDCQKVAFCYVKEGTALSKANLSTYTPDNPYVFKVPPKITIKTQVPGTSNYIFKCEFDDQDKKAVYIVNYLVMYNYLNEPIGYVDLQQSISIKEFDINYITLEFDYKESVQSGQLVFDISYTPHIVETGKNLAHRILFSEKLGIQKVSTKDEVLALVAKHKKTTRNLLDIYRNDKLLYRYSGKLALGYNHLVEKQYIVPAEVFHNEWEQPVGTISGILEVDGIEYIVIWYRSGSKLVRVTDSKVFILDFQILTPYHIANNFIVETIYLKDIKGNLVKQQYLHSTRVIVGELAENTRFSSAHMSKDSNFNEKDLALGSEYHICKDPFANELMIYKRTGEDVIYLSDKLREIINDFNNCNLWSKEIIFAAKGFLTLGEFNGECFEAKKVEFYNYNLPGKINRTVISQDYNLDEGPLRYYTNDNNTGLFDTLEVEFIVPITPDLILYQSRGSVYLSEIGIDLDKDDYAVKLNTYDLVGHYKYRNIRLVAKEYTSDYVKGGYALCYFAKDGNMFKYKDDDGKIVVNRL